MIKEFDQDEELNEEGYHDLMQLVRLHVDKITFLLEKFFQRLYLS